MIGADELLIYAMVWLVMVGAILTVRKRDHLAIDLLPARLGGRAKAAVLIATDAATALVSGFIAWHSLAFVERVAAMGSRSMGLGLPMVIPHAAITLGFVGMGVMATILLVVDLGAARMKPGPGGDAVPR